MGKKKKNRQRVPSSSVKASRGVHERGILKTVIFMRVIAETATRFKTLNKGDSKESAELDIVFNICRKILTQHFKVDEKKIENLWDRLNPDNISTNASNLFHKMRSRIIVPGQQPTGKIILAEKNINVEKFLKESSPLKPK